MTQAYIECKAKMIFQLHKKRKQSIDWQYFDVNKTQASFGSLLDGRQLLAPEGRHDTVALCPSMRQTAIKSRRSLVALSYE
jgi:hypothetical protein